MDFRLLDPYGAVVEPGHELIKNIYLDPASTQTDGEYGFGYTVKPILQEVKR